MSLEIFDFMVL